MPKSIHVVRGLQKYFLLGMLLFLIVTLFSFIAPFLSAIFIAIIIATAISPVHSFFLKKVKLSKTIISILTLLLLIILILGPLILFFFSVVGQATDAYLAISKYVNILVDTNYNFVPILEKFPTLNHWLETIINYNPLSTKDLFSTVGDMVGGISKFLLERTTGILKNLSVFVLNVIVFLLAMFYFVRDGEKIIKYVKSLIPLSEKYRQELFGKMYKLMKSIIFGIFGAAIAQGILVGIALWGVGVHNAAFWGAVAALLSPIPYIGTSVVWFPVVVYLFLIGDWALGTFLFIWGMAVVGTADNIVKPYLIGSATALHPLAVLLVILGGAFAFGFRGLIFGPFILTLTLAFLHIYQMEYQDILKGK